MTAFWFSIAILTAVLTHEPSGRASIIGNVKSKAAGAVAVQAPDPMDIGDPKLADVKRGGLGVYADSEPKTILGRVMKTLGIYQNQINESYTKAYKAIDETPPPEE